MHAKALICIGFAAAILLTFGAKAQERDWINVKQVAACLANASAHPEACLPIIKAPCVNHEENGFMRACLFRLRQRWERAIAPNGAIARLPPDPVCMASLGARLGFEPYAVRQQRNACRLFTTALTFFGMAQPRRESFVADVESAESCVLENAQVGDAASCVGLIRDFCLSDDLPEETCNARDRAVWEAIHIMHGGRKNPHRPLTELAGLAIETLLVSEGPD